MDPNKMTVFLDLDETCIHSEGLAEFIQDEDNQDVFEDYNENEKHIMGGLYIVFERPHLQTFLDYLFQNFNVCVWTAATKNYATFIVDRCIIHKKVNDKTYSKQEDRQLQYIFYQYHGKFSHKYYKTPKQLKMLSEKCRLPFDESNCIIIDDNDDVYKSQRKNCIHIKPFEDVSKRDNTLLLLMKKLDKINSYFKKNKKIN
tara:strand:- start:60 stop:662 length:603 start_codon:yes stop_codon:yes gene_type:complete